MANSDPADPALLIFFDNVRTLIVLGVAAAHTFPLPGSEPFLPAAPCRIARETGLFFIFGVMSSAPQSFACCTRQGRRGLGSTRPRTDQPEVTLILGGK